MSKIQESELMVMQDVYSSLTSLDKEEQVRVIDWVSKKLQLDQIVKSSNKHPNKMDSAINIKDFDTAGDIYAAATLSSQSEKVLLIATYLQEKTNEFITGRQINDELKNIGHPISNITSVINSLKNKTPSLMSQMKKSGRTQQAQKKYKVTLEGVRAAKKLLLPADNLES